VFPPEVDEEIIDGGDLYLPAAHGDALYAVCSPFGGLEFYHYRVGIFRFRRESEYLDGDAFFLRAFKGFLNAGIVNTHAQKPGDDPGIRHVALVGFGQGPVKGDDGLLWGPSGDAASHEAYANGSGSVRA